MEPVPELTVQCKIVGHASPRWKSARSEAERINNNEVLAQRRADAFMKEFKTALIKALDKYKLKFLENVSFTEDEQPDQTAVVGSESRGQRDAALITGNDRTSDAAIFRRTDVTVRVARSTQDSMPTKVVHRYERSKKSKFWYASCGISAGVSAGAAFEFFRIALRNNLGDEAEGSVVAAGIGGGLKYSASPYSWTEEASFSTSREVGFDDFHGTRVRYTAGGVVIGIGYSRDYLTFYGMGPDAASLHVGGWKTGLQVSAGTTAGLIVLDTVPSNYAIEKLEMTEWQEIRSDWITQHDISIFFETGQWALGSKPLAEIHAFAAKVAKDIRTN